MFIVCALLSVVGCNNDSSSGTTKKGSSGNTLEVMVVADGKIMHGRLQSVVDSLLRQPQVGLPQAEPIFDVVNIPLSSFRNTEMFRMHRNIIVCDVKPDNPDKVYRYKDSWASPQIVFEFAVKDEATLCEMVRRYGEAMVREFYKAEYRRMYKVFKGTEGIEVREAIKKQLGLTLTFSNDFEVARPNNPSSDFMWVRKETKDFGLGVLIHVLPYVDQSIFSEQVLLDSLDNEMRRHVPGPADSSYMGTERRLDFYTRTIDFDGSPYCVETRGLWRTFGDFMGGPFVNYMVLSPDKKQVVMMTGYVYYPSGRLKNTSKRNLLMQVEGICRSLKFNTAETENR